jgi:integrase
MHRKLGRFAHQASGINRDLLEKLIQATESSLKGKRDRALLLVAYDTLARRSELTSLRIEDIQHNSDRSFILLRKSKTDQDAQGKWLNINQNTYEALNLWLDSASIESGYIFRGLRKGNKVSERLESGQISRILKKLCKNAGLNQEQIRNISGHSMRVGAAQDLLISGASLPMIMAKGRWSKTDTVMRYIENTAGFDIDSKNRMQMTY